MSDEVTLGPDAGQYWAKIIRKESTNVGVKRVLNAVNSTVGPGKSNRADVFIACCQILGQDIPGEAAISVEIRAALLAMIDGYAMQVATDAS